MTEEGYSGNHTLQWHITHRCNLRCHHCYQKEYESFSKMEELLNVLNQYERFLKANRLCGHINITGGEPMASPQLFSLCREISSRGITFSLLTNGTLIDGNAALEIASYCPAYVQVSIDGNRMTHDRIRGEGAWAAAFDGIDCLRRNNVPVLVSFTAQKQNYRQLPQVARECRAHDVNLLWWDRVVTDNEEDRKRMSLSQKQFERILRQSGRLNAKYRREDGKSLVGCGRSLQFLACPENPGYICNAGKGLLAITADGNVMPCRRLPVVIGNVFNGELNDIVNGSDLIQKLRAAQPPAACSDCPHVEKCGGGSRCVTCCQTGELFARDVNCPLN